MRSLSFFFLFVASIVALCPRCGYAAGSEHARSIATTPPPSGDSGGDERPNDEAQRQASQPAGKADARNENQAPGASETSRHHKAGRGPRRARSLTARKWEEFRASIAKCVEVPLSAREACLAEARTRFREAKVDCRLLPGVQRKECVKYAKLWEDRQVDLPAAEVTQDDDPVPTHDVRDERRAEERNDGEQGVAQ